MNFKMLLKYKCIDDYYKIQTRIKIFDNDNKELFSWKYTNGDFLVSKFIVLIDISRNMFYSFEKDTESLKIEIDFFNHILPAAPCKIWYIPQLQNRYILKHYRVLM